MHDIEHAQFALTAARHLAYHAAEMAGTLDTLAQLRGAETDMMEANRWLGARALADELLEHLDGLERLVRAAADEAAPAGGRHVG